MGTRLILFLIDPKFFFSTSYLMLLSFKPNFPETHSVPLSIPFNSRNATPPHHSCFVGLLTLEVLSRTPSLKLLSKHHLLCSHNCYWKLLLKHLFVNLNNVWNYPHQLGSFWVRVVSIYGAYLYLLLRFIVFFFFLIVCLFISVWSW